MQRHPTKSIQSRALRRQVPIGVSEWARRYPLFAIAIALDGGGDDRALLLRNVITDLGKAYVTDPKWGYRLQPHIARLVGRWTNRKAYEVATNGTLRYKALMGANMGKFQAKLT